MVDLFGDVVSDASLLERCHTSPLCRSDTSSADPDDAPRVCTWCSRQLPESRSDRRFCSRVCRQSAFRIRKRHVIDQRAAKPMRVAYADPPYPGMAAKFYRDQPTYAGEVDHGSLLRSLTAEYDGWALSTSVKALRDLLPLCPVQARVCAWVKPCGVKPTTYGLHNQWEPLIVVACRSQRPGRRDWLAAQPARRGGDLPGRKPLAFCAWLFACLGMLPGDELVDLFPGTGIVGRAWSELSRRGKSDTGQKTGRSQLGATPAEAPANQQKQEG